MGVQITLGGLVLIMASFALTVVVCPNLTTEEAVSAPAWLGIVAAAALLTYQTMDNMDGKQARKTGTSSPLGLIVDHGCDALNGGIFGPLTSAAIIGTGAASWQTVAVWLCGTVPFFSNTFESYHTGSFILPLVNGPSDGLVAIALAYVGTSIAGADAWVTPITVPTANGPTPVPLRDLLVIGMLCAALLTAATQFRTAVLLALDPPAPDSPEYPTGPGVTHGAGGTLAAVRAVLRFLPIVCIAGSVVGTDAWATPLLQAAPRLVLAVGGAAFTDVTVRQMIAHVTHTEVDAAGSMISILLAWSPLAAYFGVDQRVAEATLPAALAVLLGRTLIECVILGAQLVRATGVPAFTVPTPKPKHG